MKRIAKKDAAAMAKEIAAGATLLPLAILDGYKVRWSRETVARDIVQNFFDEVADFRAVTIEVNSVEKRVRVAGPSRFDLDYLRYVGATTKIGKRAAGGFGEGFKICALVLARDYHATVTAGSGEWQIRPHLLPMKLGRELHYEVRRNAPGEEFPGSFVEINGADEALCRAFESARELFRHDDNPRLAKPLHVDAAAGIGVFFATNLKKGDVFYRRQHRALLAFPKGGGLTFAFDDALDGIAADRDRRTLRGITPLIAAVLRKLPTNVLETIITHLRVYWTKGNSVLRLAVVEAASRGVRMKFSRRWVARSERRSYQLEQHAERRGYLVAGRGFGKIGMPSFTEVFRNVEVPRVATEEEAARVAIARALHVRLVGKEPVSRGYRVCEMRNHSFYGEISVIPARSLALSFEEGIGDVLSGLASAGGRKKVSNADRLTRLIEAALSGRVDLAPYRACWEAGVAPPESLAAPTEDAKSPPEDLEEYYNTSWPMTPVIMLVPSGFPPTEELQRRVNRAAQQRHVSPVNIVYEVDSPEDGLRRFIRGMPTIWVGGQEIEPLDGPPRYGARTFTGPDGPALLPSEEVLGIALTAEARRGRLSSLRKRDRVWNKGRNAHRRFLQENHPERYRELLREEAVTEAAAAFRKAHQKPESPSYEASHVAQKIARARLAARPWNEAALAAVAGEEIARSFAEVAEALVSVDRLGSHLGHADRSSLRNDAMSRLSKALDEHDSEDAVPWLLARVPFMARLLGLASAAPLDDTCAGLCGRHATDLWFTKGGGLGVEEALGEIEASLAAAIAIAVDRHGHTDEDGQPLNCHELREELDKRLGAASLPDAKAAAKKVLAQAVTAAWEGALAEGLGEVAAAERCLEVAARMSRS